MKKTFIIISALVVLTGTAIYFKTRNNMTETPFSSQKIPVVASFYPLAFFTEQIGGAFVSVTNITPSGAEPHDYEPTTTDIQKISESKLLVLNGLGLESWGTKIENKNTITVSNTLATETIGYGAQTVTDPHVWLSPVLAKQIAIQIADALVTISPENAPYFETNKMNLLLKLSQLDEAFKKGLSRCTKHDIVTSHAAFGYIAHQYGFDQIAIAGLSPDEEPTPQKITEITNLVRQKNISYIFFESLVSPRLAQTIANETHTKTLVFNPLEGLTPDEVQRGTNYFSIQEENLINLRTALSCM